MWVSLAFAALPAKLDAQVSAEGRIVGTLRLPPGTEVMDALEALPDAPDDLNQLRTYPGRPDTGSLTWEEVEPGVFDFETVLPKRFGPIGRTAHGIYASGAFYPQPTGLPECDWVVNIELPAMGAVGTTVGSGLLSWTGRSDRVVVAVPRRARLEVTTFDGRTVRILGKGRPRKALVRGVLDHLPGHLTGDVLLIEGPMRRRLVRPAPGVALVSDRVFRLFPGMERFHSHGFVKGVATAASTHPDGLTRELEGAVTAARFKDSRRGQGARGLTRLFSWVPQIDYLLSSRRMAFYSETFEEVHPSDPVRDDLVEVVADRRPGSSVRAQLEDRYGEGTAWRVHDAVGDGLTLPQALQYAGADPHLAAEWTVPIPEQDYVLTLGESPTVTRQSDASAPPETVQIRTDAGITTATLAPGESVPLDSPSRVRIDPAGHVRQTSRRRDAWPVPPIRVVTTAFIDNVNLTRFRLSGSASVFVRGTYDTHNLYAGTVFSSRSSLIGGSLAYTRKFGPLRDGIARRHRVRFSAGPRIIDPGFLSDEDGPVSLSGGVSWSWTNRVASDFPLRGRGLSAGVSGGFFPGTSSRWITGSVGASGIASPHPRHAFAGRTSLAVARSTRPDQRLGLGGLSRMRSLPVLPPCQGGDVDPCADVADERWLGVLEYRVAPLRGMSVPLGFAWWTELQITAGLESTVVRLDSGPGSALGATVGLAGVGDVAGAEPMFIGFSGGWLLWTDGIDYAEPKGTPELYLQWFHAL